MKAHIRGEKKTAPLKLGEGTLFQNKDSKLYKICDTAEYDETYTDDEVIKVALSKEIRFKKKISKIFLIGRLCLRRIIFEE